MTNPGMTCEAFDAALADYLEGTLDGALRSAVEGHLRGCVRCTTLARDLDDIRTAAARLPDLAPSVDLWHGIEARIAAPVIPLSARPQSARRVAPAAGIGIAAAALIVATAGITYTLTARSLRDSSRQNVATIAPAVGAQTNIGDSFDQQRAIGGGAAGETASGRQDLSSAERQNSSSAPGRATRAFGGRQPDGAARLASDQSTEPAYSEGVYSREIEMLQSIVRDRKTQLDSVTVAVIERNLQIIDRAVARSKAALAADPASKLLRDQLTHALDKKVELLRTAAMLPANT